MSITCLKLKHDKEEEGWQGGKMEALICLLQGEFRFQGEGDENSMFTARKTKERKRLFKICGAKFFCTKVGYLGPQNEF